MSQAAPEQNFGPQSFRPDEIVVALEHLDLVCSLLRQAAVEYVEPPARSFKLGLGKLTIRNIQGAAGRLRSTFGKELSTSASHPSPTLAPGTTKALDDVLGTLRDVSAAKYGKWFPTMGKNRTVTRLHPSSAISHGFLPASAISHGLSPASAISHGVTPASAISYGVEPASAISHGVLPASAISYGGVGAPSTPSASRRSGWPRPAPRALGPGKGVRVGVLDTALYPNPWLAGGWRARYSDLIPADVVPEFGAGHSTLR